MRLSKNKQGFFRIGKERLDGLVFSQNQLLYLPGGAVADAQLDHVRMPFGEQAPVEEVGIFIAFNG